VVPGSASANSSPPSRPIRSWSRSTPRAVSANTFSASSPQAWPWLSLSCLKWSMSSISRAIGLRRRSASWRALSARSKKARRFSMPVRLSMVARRRISASSFCLHSNRKPKPFTIIRR
jgi:hypothetical protein